MDTSQKARDLIATIAFWSICTNDGGLTAKKAFTYLNGIEEGWCRPFLKENNVWDWEYIQPR